MSFLIAASLQQLQAAASCFCRPGNIWTYASSLLCCCVQQGTLHPWRFLVQRRGRQSMEHSNEMKARDGNASSIHTADNPFPSFSLPPPPSPYPRLTRTHSACPLLHATLTIYNRPHVHNTKYVKSGQHNTGASRLPRTLSTLQQRWETKGGEH